MHAADRGTTASIVSAGVRPVTREPFAWSILGSAGDTSAEPPAAAHWPTTLEDLRWLALPRPQA